MTLWGGRFSKKMNAAAWDLNASLPFDQRLALQDIQGSQAWARALRRADIIAPAECEQITSNLEKIRQEFLQGIFDFKSSDEDIHTAVERRLVELAGPVGSKLHTGRSRNDQVATDFRLWFLDNLPTLDTALLALQQTLVNRAEQDFSIVMPGYTHLQRAQPILLSHWWLSHFWPLQRDRQRLENIKKWIGVMPLGSGALAGTAFPIDREALAQELGFSAPSPNSLDGVSDRDFVVEFLFSCSLIGVHLSRLAEMMVLYSTAEFGYFELSDEYATGSSLMPQKKNPDVFELARGKSGALLGMLTGMLSTLKGLPSAYDKDLQEDKVPVFSAFDTLISLLPVLAGALETLAVNSERMRAGIDAGMLATDLADYLVGKDLPFREAHAVAGKAVQLAQEQGKTLDKIELEEFQTLHPAFDKDVTVVFNPLYSLSRRSSIGGTGHKAVEAQLAEARLCLANINHFP